MKFDVSLPVLGEDVTGRIRLTHRFFFWWRWRVEFKAKWNCYQRKTLWVSRWFRGRDPALKDALGWLESVHGERVENA